MRPFLMRGFFLFLFLFTHSHSHFFDFFDFVTHFFDFVRYKLDNNIFSVKKRIVKIAEIEINCCLQFLVNFCIDLEMYYFL